MLTISKVIAEEVLLILRQVLDGDTGINVKVARNTLGKGESRLYDDAVTALESSDDIVVRLLVNHYIIFIEHGRRKGAKRPPFQPIYEWAKRKGLPTDNGFIWAVMQSIVEDGIAPRPVMARTFDLIDKRFDSVWSDQIFDEIVKSLDEVFK